MSLTFLTYNFLFYIYFLLFCSHYGTVFIYGKTQYLCIDGYLYIRHSLGNGIVYFWRKQKDKCPAKVVILGHYITGNIVVCNDPAISKHSHVPDGEEITALKLVGTLKRKATEHPEIPTVQILLIVHPDSVLFQLSDIDNIHKALQHLCTKDMPANLRNI